MQNKSLSRELNSAIHRLKAAQELVRQELLEVTRLSDLLQDLIIQQNPDENYHRLPVAHVIRVAQTQQPVLNPEPEVQDLRTTLLGSSFSVGDTVRISNPRRGQPSQGVIIGAGRRYINVQGTDNQIISRAPKNLKLISETTIQR